MNNQNVDENINDEISSEGPIIRNNVESIQINTHNPFLRGKGKAKQNNYNSNEELKFKFNTNHCTKNNYMTNRGD